MGESGRQAAWLFLKRYTFVERVGFSVSGKREIRFALFEKNKANFFCPFSPLKKYTFLQGGEAFSAKRRAGNAGPGEARQESLPA